MQQKSTGSRRKRSGLLGSRRARTQYVSEPLSISAQRARLSCTLLLRRADEVFDARVQGACASSTYARPSVIKRSHAGSSIELRSLAREVRSTRTSRSARSRSTSCSHSHGMGLCASSKRTSREPLQLLATKSLISAALACPRWRKLVSPQIESLVTMRSSSRRLPKIDDRML